MRRMDHRVFGVINDGQLVWNHSEACGCDRRIEAAREYAPRASRPAKRLVRTPLSVLLFFSAKVASRERPAGEALTRTPVAYGTGLMALGLVLLSAAGCRRQGPANASVENKQPAAAIWPSEPPPGCPFPSSTEITGIAFTGGTGSTKTPTRGICPGLLMGTCTLLMPTAPLGALKWHRRVLRRPQAKP